MNTHRISFDTNLGRSHYDVPEDLVLDRVAKINDLPGTSNVSVQMLDTDPDN